MRGKRILFMAAVLGLAGAAVAQAEVTKFGLGIVVGSPTGISGKYWIDSRHAIDGVFSLPGKNEVYLHGDYLWHDFRAFPAPERGRLPLYYGVGGVASSDRVGVRGIGGIEYIFDDYPFDLFLELAPVMGLAPDFDLSFAGGLGGRYYFGKGSRRGR
jgi:hypothetical protein